MESISELIRTSPKFKATYKQKSEGFDIILDTFKTHSSLSLRMRTKQFSVLEKVMEQAQGLELKSASIYHDMILDEDGDYTIEYCDFTIQFNREASLHSVEAVKIILNGGSTYSETQDDMNTLLGKYIHAMGFPKKLMYALHEFEFRGDLMNEQFMILHESVPLYFVNPIPQIKGEFCEIRDNFVMCNNNELLINYNGDFSDIFIKSKQHSREQLSQDFTRWQPILHTLNENYREQLNFQRE